MGTLGLRVFPVLDSLMCWRAPVALPQTDLSEPLLSCLCDLLIIFVVCHCIPQ